MTTTIRFSDLTVAIDRCMQAHPPTGAELRLHPDANAMAELFGHMTWFNLQEMEQSEVEALGSKILPALTRWSIDSNVK